MASHTPELRQRTGSSSSSPFRARRPAAGYLAPLMSPPAFPTYSLYSRQQLLWLQQAYARQFYLQYHAALVAAGSAPLATTSTAAPYPPVPAHPVPVPVALANQNALNNLPVNQNAAPDGAFVNPGGADQNLRMNAQGGPMMEDEEDMERDWLDWVYSAARFAVLLAIIYFNSTLSRFLLVTSTLLLMYIHAAGWFPFRRAQVQEPNPPQPLVVQQNQNQDGQQENRLEGPGGPEAPGDPVTVVLVPPHRVSLMWTAWVFFKTFFSSLIPEVPQGVAN